MKLTELCQVIQDVSNITVTLLDVYKRQPVNFMIFRNASI